MKKLMIAAAMVALTMGVNAAALDWKFTTAKTQVSGLTAYILVGDTVKTDWASATEIATAAAAYEVIEGSSAHGEPKKTGSGANVSYNATGTLKAEGSVAGGDTPLTSWYMIVVDSVNNKYYATDATSAGIREDNASQSIQSTSWSTLKTTTAHEFQSVPEPTSGLLLLLGVAGLALRRRRA